MATLPLRKIREKPWRREEGRHGAEGALHPAGKGRKSIHRTERGAQKREKRGQEVGGGVLLLSRSKSNQTLLEVGGEERCLETLREIG